MSSQNLGTGTYTINIQAEMSNIKGVMQEFQSQLGKVKMPALDATKLKTQFESLYKEMDKISEIGMKSKKGKGDATQLEKSQDKIRSILSQITAEYDKINSKQIEFNVKEPQELERARETLKSLQDQLREKVKIQTFDGIKESIDTIASVSSGKLVTALKDAFNAKDVAGYEAALEQIAEKMNMFGPKGGTKIGEIRKEVTNLVQSLKTMDSKGIDDTIKKLEGMKTEATDAEKKFIDFAESIALLKQRQQGIENAPGIQKLKEEIGLTDAQVKQLAQTIQNEMVNGLHQAEAAANQSADGLNKMVDNTKEATVAQAQLNSSLDQLKSRITYFFGLVNAVQLFKRALRDTFNTVKELDKSMTETAVVTNFSVGDMWKQLPQYTESAKQFGATIKGVYDVMTLYYQQGLNQDTAWALGTETLKLARIAGLEYADATDRMTNALRGFNMELNATNAQRVDDVYSKLAAMSASNVDELSIAMTKTASIAKSANMEFETTAAFLAQIIETTREAPETAGTALKTVIARFSEVKKLYSEGQLTGQDEEGEEINVNKVAAALKTAGIEMNEYFTGAKGLDEIFMELAKRWDSLDLVQQRYIATMAAGSRQQSRFIAMMSDYGRTMELVEGAQNATGASSLQFEKTQESLQSKLAKLKDTWQEFSMGIANSGAIKSAVDGLTLLIDGLNLLTTTGDSFTTTLSKLNILTNIFTLGKIGIESLLQELSSTLQGKLPEIASEGATTFKQAFVNGLKDFGESGLNFNKLAKEISQMKKGIYNLNDVKVDWEKIIPTKQLEGEIAKLNLPENFSQKLQQMFQNGASVSTTGTTQILQIIEANFVNKLKGLGTNIEDIGLYDFFTKLNEQTRNGEKDISTAIEEIINHFEELKTAGTLPSNESFDQMVQSLREIGATAEQVREQIKSIMFEQKMQELQKSIQNTQLALSGLSMLFNLVGNAAEKLTGKSNLLSSAFKGIGGALTSGASVLMGIKMLTTALKGATGAAAAFGTTLATVAPWLAALAIVVSAVIQIGTAIAQAKQKAAEAANELAKADQEEADANRDLLKSYKDLKEEIEAGTITKEELEDESRKLVAAYGLEEQGLDALTNSYEELAEAAKKAQAAKDLAAAESSSEAVDANHQVLASKTKRETNYSKIKGNSSDIPQLLINALKSNIEQFDWSKKLSFKTKNNTIYIEGLENLSDTEFSAYMQAYDNARSQYTSEWNNGAMANNMQAFQNEYSDYLNSFRENLTNEKADLGNAYLNQTGTDLNQHFSSYEGYVDWMNSQVEQFKQMNTDIKLSDKEIRDIIKEFYADYANDTDAFYAKIEDLYGDTDVADYLANLGKDYQRYLTNNKVLMTEGKTKEQFEKELTSAAFDDYWNRGARMSQISADYLTKAASDKGIDEKDLEALKTSLKEMPSFQSDLYSDAAEEWDALRLDSAGYSAQSEYLKRARENAIVASNAYQQAYFDTMGEGIVSQAEDYEAVRTNEYDAPQHSEEYKTANKLKGKYEDLLNTPVMANYNAGTELFPKIQYYTGSVLEDKPEDSLDTAEQNYLDWAKKAADTLAKRTLEEQYPDLNEETEEYQKEYQKAYNYWMKQTGTTVEAALEKEYTEITGIVDGTDSVYNEWLQGKTDQENKRNTIGGQLIESGMEIEDIKSLFSPDATADSETITNNLLKITDLLGQLQDDGLEEYFGIKDATEATTEAAAKLRPMLVAIGEENKYNLNTLEGQKAAYTAIESKVNAIHKDSLDIDVEGIDDVETATKALEKFANIYAYLAEDLKRQNLEIKINDSKSAAADLKKFNDTWNTMSKNFSMDSTAFEKAAKDFPKIMDAFQGINLDGTIQLSGSKMKELAAEMKESVSGMIMSAEELKAAIAEIQTRSESLTKIAAALSVINAANEEQQVSWMNLSAVEQAEARAMVTAAIQKANAEISAANDTMDSNVQVANSAEEMGAVVAASCAQAANAYLQMAACASEAARAAAAAKNGDSSYEFKQPTFSEVKAVKSTGATTASGNTVTASEMKTSTGKTAVTGEKMDDAIDLFTAGSYGIVEENGQYYWTDKDGKKVTDPRENKALQFTQEEMATLYTAQGYLQENWQNEYDKNNQNGVDLITSQADLIKQLNRLGSWDNSSGGKGGSGGGKGGSDSKDEDGRSKEDIEKENAQARLNTLKSEEADIDRELGLLQKLPIRLYPLELAMQGRKLANLKKQIVAQKEVVKQSEAELASLRKKNSQLDKYYTIEETKDDFGNTQRTFQYSDQYINASEEERKQADEGGLNDIKSAVDTTNTENDALSGLMGDFGGQALDMLNSGIDMAKQAIEKMVEVFSALVDWWTNREDWLYNLLSKIEQETRNFARLQQVEERFRLGSTEGVDELVAAWYAQKESLDKQIALEEELIASRKAELQFLNLTNLLFSPAFHYDYKEERVIENPWVYDIYKLVLKMGSLVPEIGGVFSSLESLMEDNKARMEKAVQDIEDAKDKILEIEKQQLELRQQYMDDEVSLEELVMGKIIEKMQEEIDSMTALSEAISEANSKLLETLQNNLEKMRQDRENANTEEELAKKERRLAYLRQDTSGANQVEIRKLEEELDKGHQDYTDKLIDQKITELQKQNDKAAAQREAQINLAQAQLDYTERYGLQWEEARELIKNGYDDQGRLRVGSELFDLLMSSEDFAGLGAGSTRQLSQRMEWDITGIAGATFRAINDVWNKGFLLNNPQTNNVHPEEEPKKYNHLPQYLNFLQPAYEALQDYFVNWTGKNIEAFLHQLGDEDTSPLASRKIIGWVKRTIANASIDTSTQSNRGNINYATTTTPDLFKANNYGNKTTQNTISSRTYQNNIVNYNNFNTNVGNNWDRAGIVTVMRDVLGEWTDGLMSFLNPFDNSRSH